MGKFPEIDLSCPSVGTRGRDREPIGISKIWKARVKGPFESWNNERILAMDLRKDVCRVIIPTGKLAIGTHIREQFDLALGEVWGLIWTVHSFGTRVKNPQKVGDQHFMDPEDRNPLHFGIAKSETPKGDKATILWISGHVGQEFIQEG
jgi:hypothetical protein